MKKKSAASSKRPSLPSGAIRANASCSAVVPLALHIRVWGCSGHYTQRVAFIGVGRSNKLQTYSNI